jgi:hypothetical protein
LGDSEGKNVSHFIEDICFKIWSGKEDYVSRANFRFLPEGK